MPGRPLSNSRDRFGIAMLYPSVDESRQWFSTWDNGVKRTLKSWQRDESRVSDFAMYMRGNGWVEIEVKESRG